MIAYDGINNRLVDEQAFLREPVYKGVGVLVGGKLPGGALQPEGLARRVRQIRHEGSHFKDDTEKTPYSGTGAVVAFVSCPRSVRLVLP
jgi:hypothetical protein